MGQLLRSVDAAYAAAMVRLMHSMVRVNALQRSDKWDAEVYGMPIPQVDQMPAGLINMYVLATATLRSGRTTLVEFTVPAGHWMQGRRLGSVSWPADVSVVTIIRDTRPITPSDDDVMEVADELFFLATEESESRLRDLLVPEQERQARAARRPRRGSARDQAGAEGS